MNNTIHSCPVTRQSALLSVDLDRWMFEDCCWRWDPYKKCFPNHAGSSCSRIYVAATGSCQALPDALNMSWHWPNSQAMRSCSLDSRKNIIDLSCPAFMTFCSLPNGRKQRVLTRDGPPSSAKTPKRTSRAAICPRRSLHSSQFKDL